MEDIIVDYNLDGSITVDYIGSDENKKTIVKNIHDTLYELFNKKEVEETRLTRNVTGAFLTVYVKGDKKIVTNISNFIETYIQAMDEYVNKIKNEGERLNDEKKPNQHD